MHKLRRVDPADREKLIESVKEFAQKLKILFPIEKIYLYGAVARGEIHEGSDIDLIIVGNFKERFFERIGLILELTELPIEPLVYTSEEFKALQEEGNPLIEEALRTGVEL
ncbi:nucleotidyltransferase domain-containing protein [Atrimonas thermophila]|uniref:nucleotidyltransferase domain-containing protein n=1 Tax=Atrimonas thermophila TaxID=3064161 RepID=UPI00399D4AE5